MSPYWYNMLTGTNRAIARRAEVRKKIRKREILPPWNMPADPVKGLFWFLHWLLKVLVRFFWIPIIGMTLYETYINGVVGGLFNGVVGGVITLLVGLVVWVLLYALLLCFNVGTKIRDTISDVNRMQQNFSSRRPFYPFSDAEDNVVEGTITDLEEERKKRRRE
jgi:hypothetical protein